MPARAAYCAANAGVRCRRRVACSASYSSRRRIRSTRSRPLATHCARAGQARQAARPKRMRAIGWPSASAVSFQATLACPCGQVACRAAQSMAKSVRREALVGARLPAPLRPGGADQVARHGSSGGSPACAAAT